MPTRKRPPEHADIRRPIDHRFTVTQQTKLAVWLLYDGDTTPFAEIHLNERGARSRSPRLMEACALLVLAGDTFNFVEAVARLGDLPVTGEDVLPTLIEHARAIVSRKETFNP